MSGKKASMGTPRIASERLEMGQGANLSSSLPQTTHLSKCPECGGSYARKRKHQTFCSSRCRKRSWERERKVRPSYDIRKKLDEILASLARIEDKMGIES